MPWRGEKGGKMKNEKASGPVGPGTRQEYWRRNLRILTVLLGIWFLVSFGCGILAADALNQIRVGGFRLGFWFAQQGSIYVFVILIFVYVARMNALDKEFDVHEE